MLDEELKKELLDMKLDDVVEVLEARSNEAHTEPLEEAPSIQDQSEPPENTKESFFSVKLVFITVPALALLVGFYLYFSSVQNPTFVSEETVQTTNSGEPSQARVLLDTITQQDAQVGQSAQLVWDMLEEREESLTEITNDLSTLLYKHAEIPQDLFEKQSAIQMAKYQAMDARFAVEIQAAMRLLENMAVETKNYLLAQNVKQYELALGSQGYMNHELQFIKGILQQEEVYKRGLQALMKSTTLQEVEKNFLAAKEILSQIENNEATNPFTEFSSLQSELTPKLEQALANIFFNRPSEILPGSEATLQSILSKSDLSEKQKSVWRNELRSIERERKQSAS